MFILLNGSFGIGKTTTARALVRAMKGAAISDPEHVGFVLRRLPAWMLGLKQRPPDYQDMALWHRLIVSQARWMRGRADIVVAPMAFTNRSYFEAFETALKQRAEVTKVCLVAPLDVVRERLATRAAAEGRSGLTEFELRRSAECVVAHQDTFFGRPIDATQPKDAIVAGVLAAAGKTAG